MIYLRKMAIMATQKIVSIYKDYWSAIQELVKFSVPAVCLSAAIREWHWAPKMLQTFGVTLMLVDETKVLQILIKTQARPNSVLTASLVQECDDWKSWAKHARPDKESYSLYNFILFAVFCYICICQCLNIQFISCWCSSSCDKLYDWKLRFWTTVAQAVLTQPSVVSAVIWRSLKRCWRNRQLYQQ